MSKKVTVVALLVSSFSVFAQVDQGERYIIKGLNPSQAKSEIEKVGGFFQKNLRYHQASVAKMSGQALERLKQKFSNLQVEVDHPVSIDARPTKPGGGDTTPPPQVIPWGVSHIKATEAGSISTGAGITVCVVDTGVDIDHPDLVGRIVGGENFVAIKGKVDPLAYDDDNNHGTHVSGTIAANDNEIGVVGVAPESSIFAAKVLDRRGSGYNSDVAEGVTSCVTNGTHIISMSLGSSQSTTLLHDAIKDAVSAGLIVVAAAGNDSGPVGYPAAHPEVIAVSATDSSNQLAYFSNRGPEIDFAAPGVNVLSTVKGGGYSSFNGTSMATPHVSAVYALQLAAGTSSVKADDIGLSVEHQGQGLVNALRTVTEP